MGDDERFDYLYKFVSTEHLDRPERACAPAAHNKTLLTAGSLYVARFSGRLPGRRDRRNGSAPVGRRLRRHRAEWIPLVIDGVSQVPGFSADRGRWSTRGSPRTPSAPRRWTAARTSSRTPAPGASTSCAPTTPTAARSARKARPRSNPRNATATATSSRSPRRATTRPRRPSAGASCCSAGDPATNPSTYFAGLPRRQGVAHLLPGQRRVRLGRGNMWLATDGAPGRHRVLRRPVQGAARGPRARPRPAVPVGAAETARPAGRWSATRTAWSTSPCSTPARTARGPRSARTSPTTWRPARSPTASGAGPAPRHPGLEAVAPAGMTNAPAA